MSKLSYYKTIVKTAFLLSLILFQTADVKAQSSFGIAVGTGKSSLNRIQGPTEDINRYSSRSFFSGGITADLPIGNIGFSLSAAAIYTQKGYNYSLQNTTGVNNTIKDSAYLQDLNYIDVSLLLCKKFSLTEKASFFIGAGPVMNVFISGKEEISKTYFGSILPSEKITNSDLQTGSSAGNYKRVYPSMSFVAGVQFNRISLWLNYNLPLDYYYIDPARLEHQYSMKTFGISAGYTLFRGKGEEREKKEKREKPDKTVVPVKIDSLADRDSDGIADYKDKCPGHKGIAKYGGCPVPDADGDGINDDDDTCPMVAGPLNNSGCPLFAEPVNNNNSSNNDNNTGSKDTMHYTIYFEPASSHLRTEGFNTLAEVVRLLKTNPNLAAQFNGHTDNVGSVEANSIRAFGRAMVCVDYVSSFFIERNRLTAAAFSNKKPAADLNDPLLQWKNRRVEVLVFEKDE